MLSQQDIRSSFPAWTHVLLYDTTYARPTNEWLFDKFYPWFWKKIGTYTRKNDCDNFARLFCALCQQAHADSSNSAEAVAVGEFLYISANGPHAIVTAFTDIGQVFLEPQNGRRLTLSQNELLSCFHVAF